MPSKDNSVASCAQQILTQVKTVVVGKDPVLLWVLAAILARGHILLEDIPGVGKTTMALAFSRVLSLSCSPRAVYPGRSALRRDGLFRA